MSKLLLAPALLFGLLFASTAAFADEAGDCASAAGSYLTGKVTTAPYYKSGKMQKGVELSHTHVTITADQDGKSYDIAMDNVFAAGYDSAGQAVPSPLSGIAKGDHLSLCGQLYSGSSLGIHWVHTNCGVTPTSAKPNGWVKRSGDKSNMEDNTEYCGLWN
jgi:hypothetical protein